MATQEQLAQWIVSNKAKKGTPEFETVSKAYMELRQGADNVSNTNRLDNSTSNINGSEQANISSNRVGGEATGADNSGPQGSIAKYVEPALTLVSGAAAEPVAGLAGIAQSANPFADPGAGARAVESTREALTYQPKTDQGKEGLKNVASFVEPVAEVLQASEKTLGDTAFEYTKSPALAAAATTIPTALLEVIGVASAKGALRSGRGIKKTAGDRSVRRAVVNSAPEVDEIKKTARQVYKEIDDSGVVVKGDALSDLANSIDNAFRKKGFNRNVAPQLAPKADAALKTVESMKGKSLSLSELDNLRETAGIAASSIDKKEAALGVKMLDILDNKLDSLKPSDLVKGELKSGEIMPKYRVARELWGRARRSEMINEAFGKAANQATGFENGIRTQFRSILNNKNKSKYFKPDEIAAMRDVVRGTKKENLAKLVGRLGFSEGGATNIIGGSIGVGVGASLGGPVGAVVVPVIGQVSRKLAQRLTKGNADFADAVTRAGDKADDIIRAYMKHTPRSARSPEELSQLLLRKDISLDSPMMAKNSMVREAAEIASGRRLLNAAPTYSAASETKNINGESQ